MGSFGGSRRSGNWERFVLRLDRNGVAFAYALERCSYRSGRGSTLYYRLETTLVGEEVPSVEWIPRAELGTRLARRDLEVKGSVRSRRLVLRG